MFFEQVLYRDLGCASYIFGDGAEAIVVDPRWDIEVYLRIAERERMRIAHVLDTHDHADHVSGRLRLAQATGARAYRPARGSQRSRDEIAAGDELMVGEVRLKALATPGHRPEHLAFAVFDLARASEVWLLLTGDSLLVGDVGRPDLAVDATQGAHALYSSLRPLLELGDHVEVWPAHIGGSLCGGAGLSGKSSSTIGFERHHNPVLRLAEPEFSEILMWSMPPRPPNIETVVELNQGTDPQSPPELALVKASRLQALLRSPVTVIDGRLPAEFDAFHLAGSLNLPAISVGVGTRAGWSVRPEEPILIVAEDADTARGMALALHAVGLWRTVGCTIADESSWKGEGLPVAGAEAWDIEQLAAGLRSGRVDLIDVRDSSEWAGGHVAGSRHLPLHRLRDGHGTHLRANGRTTAVACAGGLRAAFAASILRRAGCRDVVRVADGGILDLPGRGLGLDVGEQP